MGTVSPPWRMLIVTGLALVLQACGGGGSTEEAPARTEASVQATLRPAVQVWNSAQLAAIQAEQPGSISVRGSPAVAVGDIVLTGNTALKVQALSAPDASGVLQITGTTPELDEVLSHLAVDISEFQLTPDMFVPAEGVELTTAQSQRTHAMDARMRPQATTITATLSRALGAGLTGELQLSFTPKVSYAIDSASLTGTASVKGQLSVTPKLTFSSGLKLAEKVIPIGYYRMPLTAPGVPPGFLMLKVPIEARFSATAGKVKASVGATGTADFGVQAMVMPTDVDLAVIGDGVSFAPNNQYFDFDAGVSAEVEARLVTGVSLSAMFGWSEPLAAKVGTGVRGTFTYAAVSSSGAVPFDASCVQAVMEKVQDFTISAKFFGLRKSKVTVEKAIEFLRSKRPSHCTVAEHAVNVNASWRPAFNGDARTGAVTRLELATLDGGSPVQPGAVLEVETRGAYYFGASTQTANNGAGVFASGTGALLAAAAGSTAGPATTALDCASGPDPVAEDFSIPFGGSATVVVPQGASALLIGVDDCVFADNAHVSAQDLVRIRLSVLSNPPARAD